MAGGLGTRLFPLTKVYSKQLQPVYDKPMIYYPLSVLMMAGIRDILIISTETDTPQIEKILNDGRQLGLNITYQIQYSPKGIPDAFLLGENFLKNDSCMLILGDNFFYGNIDFLKHNILDQRGATIYSLPVVDPQNYGVVEFRKPDFKILSIEEKPSVPKSHYAIPGLYFFDQRVVQLTQKLKLSKRNELEIIDLIILYWQMGELQLIPLSRGLAWLDMGTPQSLLEASLYVKVIEERQGLKIACLEEIAFRQGLINEEMLKELISSMPKSSYRTYLDRVVLES